jgi:cis-L-3-hydroxyproline dehydratase
VIDASHPLARQCVSGTVLCLPSGRGSCTASQVLLELLLRHQAPAALILRDPDGLACVGAIIAQEIFDDYCPMDILCVGDAGYAQLLAADAGSNWSSDWCKRGRHEWGRNWTSERCKRG